MRRLLAAAALSLAVLLGVLAPTSAAPLPRVGPPGYTTTVTTSTSYGGVARSFVLHVPDGLLAPAPVVVALTALYMNASGLREITRLEALADSQGFVVVFPSAVDSSWAAGGCCGGARSAHVNDVAFLDQVIADVRRRVIIDPARIGLTGLSNGGMMALRYACERSNVVAAVAVVAAPLMARCPITSRVDVLELHGATDDHVPFRGGRNDALNAVFPPVALSLGPFRAAGGDVVTRVVPRVGHAWMTRRNSPVDATALVWEWLRDHPRTS